MASAPKATPLVFAAAAVVATPDGAQDHRRGVDGDDRQASPESVDDPDEHLGDAVAFAVLSGAAAGLIRMLINRNARKLLRA